MKKSPRKLHIRRETLTSLHSLDRVAGGYSWEFYTCQGYTCEVCTLQAACRTDGSCVSIDAMCFHTAEPGCGPD